ncbi:HEPN domain-containing protein [Hydrobacter penzbergensis]|uniref:HEPN domain-containing protein n=1 Tax=Hydrobacter penzbergensis TaxID=1235997 RepID=A0A8X8LD20_9BACT|nr:HEPN domain-containing protein [Hydrobacter penzbergensis]SDX68861.1 HEPN domain-containing protein [Hydrobacter penzbergensis]
MKPFTIYHLCPDAFSFLQQPLIDMIVKAAKPDMIFLLGASLWHRRSESVFNESAPDSQHLSDCFLLVLMPGFGNKEPHEWQDKIEANCKSIMPVTIIVLQTATFESWLKAGHRFALTVWQSASPIYDSGNVSMVIPQGFTGIGMNKEEEKQYSDGLMKAKEFLAGSELFRIRKQHAMAAFMLHQSAEQALRTLLRTSAGYYANTHSLDRLIRYASFVSHQLPDIFRQKTDEEKRLFSLLQKAYIDTRYKEDYKISNDDLVCLSEKIRYLHEILADVGRIYNAIDI